MGALLMIETDFSSISPDDVYDDDDLRRDWQSGVPADVIAKRAGRSLQGIYNRIRRMGIGGREPVAFEDPEMAARDLPCAPSIHAFGRKRGPRKRVK